MTIQFNETIQRFATSSREFLENVHALAVVPTSEHDVVVQIVVKSIELGPLLEARRLLGILAWYAS